MGGQIREKNNSESGPARRPFTLAVYRLIQPQAGLYFIHPFRVCTGLLLHSFHSSSSTQSLFFSFLFVLFVPPETRPAIHLHPRHVTATAFTTLHPFFPTNAGHRPRICIVNPSSITCHDPTHDRYIPKHTIIHSRPIHKIKRCYYVHQERREYRFSPLSSLSSRPVCLC